MHQDFYLKFETKADAYAVLYRTEGEEALPNFGNIDTIGVIYKNDGVFSEDGEVITQPTQLDGWYVNIRLSDGEDAATLAPFAVIPTAPRRVFA